MPLGTKVDLGPGDIVLDGNPARPQGGHSIPPILAHVLWPNGCMDQGATWYWGRPPSRRHWVTGGPSSPLKRGTPPPSFRPVCMYEDTIWCGGRPQPRRHCVKWGFSSPRKGHSTPTTFWPMCIVAKWLDGSRCHLIRE